MFGENQVYYLTEEHEQRIRSAVASADCRVIFSLEEYEAYKAEQEQAKAAAMTGRRRRPEEEEEVGGCCICQ